MAFTRRKFLSLQSKLLAAALLGSSGGLSIGSGCSGSGGGSGDSASSHPNILLLMLDQFRLPPSGYGPSEGVVQDMREILGFEELSRYNAFLNYFNGFLRLRRNAVVMRTHYAAATACSPSRACIFTGQYTTGVEQTTGIFKTNEDVPWLDPEGIPTLGDWFRAAGYTTHYFGKWHVSDPTDPDYLEPWGFSNWESSYPEPHGSNPYNLAVYRDIGFADNLSDFLTEKGQDGAGAPWLAVGSLVNPHDGSAWPVSWQLPLDRGVVPWTPFPPPLSIPAQSDQSLPNPDGLIVDLNPDGFPQDNFSLPPTYNENLEDKPRCQYEYSLKYGLAVKSKAPLPSPFPFQLQGEYATPWALAYDRFYTYVHYLADLQLRRILDSLDSNGLTENTIVVFLADHGELAAAHGSMIQKWHNAYEEAIRVPLVVSSPLVNPDQENMRSITQPTSSIDLTPTLLGLAGFSFENINQTDTGLGKHSPVNDFVGADLSPWIRGYTTEDIPGADGQPRPGVFFMTNDLITEPGPNPDTTSQLQYARFLNQVEETIADGYHLESGPVLQPNNVRALCTGDWKIARYVDPKGVASDEWELYHLESDPVERINLVNFRTGEIRDDVTVPGWSSNALKAKNEELKVQLVQQEALMLHQNS